VTAAIVLAGFAIAVVGVIAKVAVDVARDLRADREAHGGRLTRAAAARAWWAIGIVLLLVLLLIVLPLLLADDSRSPLG
jgi:H+/Cl- antiporter ClcA